jgi:hypothetical protein
MLLINKDNYQILIDYLPDDIEIKEWFEVMHKIITSPYVDSKENIERGSHVEIEGFINQLNEWLKTGIINIPEEIMELQEQKKMSVNSPDYNSDKNLTQQKSFTKPVIIGFKNRNQELAQEAIRVANSNKATNFMASNSKSTELLNDALEKKTNRINKMISPDYPSNNFNQHFSVQDQQIISELKLPKSKEYIYKSLRQHFGSPINISKLDEYGRNKFAKHLVQLYPSGFRRTEILTVLDKVLQYDEMISPD